AALLAGAAEQEHSLLAEHVPEPPGHAEAERAAVQIERDGALIELIWVNGEAEYFCNLGWTGFR
ncbi:MAG TPA: hypothetical protein VIM02_15895, partial [Rhizomicrobium sp.]